MSTGSSCNAGWQLGRATINGKERSRARWLVGDRLLQSPLSDTCNVNSDIWSHHHPLQGAPAFTFINCSATAGEYRLSRSRKPHLARVAGRPPVLPSVKSPQIKFRSPHAKQSLTFSKEVAPEFTVALSTSVPFSRVSRLTALGI